MIRRIAPALVPIILSALLLLVALFMAPAASAPATADSTDDPAAVSVPAVDSTDHPAEDQAPVTVAVDPEPLIDETTGEFIGDGSDDQSVDSDGPAEVTTPDGDALLIDEDDTDAPADDQDDWAPDADAINVSITYGSDGEAESVELTDAEGNDVPVGSISESWGE